MTLTSRRVLIALLFALELLNGIFHHGVPHAKPAGSFGWADLLATGILLILLGAVGAVGAWSSRRLRIGASWAAGFWFYAMLTSYLIVLALGPADAAVQNTGASLLVAVMLAPVAALIGCAGVLLARRSAES